MSRTADTSIVVPALLIAHEAHARCRAALAATTASVGHVMLEAYSVLTRLPHPLRIPRQVAAEALARGLPEPTVALDATAYSTVAAQLAAAGLSGGSVYDALIALTSAEHGLELLTRDARAAKTYRSLGVAFELMA